MVFALVFLVQIFNSLKKNNSLRPPFALQHAILVCPAGWRIFQVVLLRKPHDGGGRAFACGGNSLQVQTTSCCSSRCKINARHFRFRYGDSPSPFWLLFIFSALQMIRNYPNQAKQTVSLRCQTWNRPYRLYSPFKPFHILCLPYRISWKAKRLCAQRHLPSRQH